MRIDDEDDLKLYTQLSDYQQIADEMATEVEMEDKISFKKKQEVLYPIIDEIKEIADKLIENYILYIKNKDDLRRMESLRDDINTILEKIDIFKEKIYELYEMEK